MWDAGTWKEKAFKKINKKSGLFIYGKKVVRLWDFIVLIQKERYLKNKSLSFSLKIKLTVGEFLSTKEIKWAFSALHLGERGVLNSELEIEGNAKAL